MCSDSEMKDEALDGGSDTVRSSWLCCPNNFHFEECVELFYKSERIEFRYIKFMTIIIPPRIRLIILRDQELLLYIFSQTGRMRRAHKKWREMGFPE